MWGFISGCGSILLTVISLLITFSIADKRGWDPMGWKLWATHLLIAIPSVTIMVIILILLASNA